LATTSEFLKAMRSGLMWADLLVPELGRRTARVSVTTMALQRAKWMVLMMAREMDPTTVIVKAMQSGMPMETALEIPLGLMSAS
jgi:predicted membrane-bound spermidine synthase